MSPTEDYEYFVCYYEIAAGDFAKIIYDTITNECGSKVYVDHIIREQMSGPFRPIIDNIIKKSKVFILLNTIGTLSRSEVIREVKVAFPEGILDGHAFWVFRENKEDVPRGTPEFRKQTKIDLTEYTQPEFANTHELARLILRKCKGNYVLSEQGVYLFSFLDVIEGDIRP
jgi:hypothetical protein